MRTSTRVGSVVGSVGSVALCILQFRFALAIVPLIVLGGVLAGLAVAKWLDRAHYGRQLEEGFYAGMLAAGLSGFIALLSLLTAGPRDIATLAERSRLGGFDVAPLVRQLSPLGWFMVDVLVVLSAVATGVLLAAFLVQILAWSKSRRAARVVQQAHLAALAFQRGEEWDGAPVPSVVLQGTSSITALAVAARGQSGQFRTGLAGAALLPPTFRSTMPPAPSSVSQALHTSGALLWPASPSSSTALRSRDAAPLNSVPSTPPAVASPDSPAADAASASETAAAPARRPARRKTSQARPVEGQLNDEMRRALAAWADNGTQSSAQSDADNDAAGNDQARTPSASSGASRIPAPSTYLNSGPPAPKPKRNRKKNQTRDWIC